MLNLGVSTQPCLPGKKAPSREGEARPTKCEACAAPGGAGGVLLEPHLVGAGRTKFLCPLCHICLHLDVAGRKKAGRVIWLPEFSQEQLNLLVLAMFVSLRKKGVYRNDEGVKALNESSLRLYKALDRRAESVEIFLGGNAAKSLMPRHGLSSPGHIASLLVRVRRETKLSARDLAARVDGLRLLAAPEAFEAYIGQVARIATADFPVPTWPERAAAAVAAHQAAAAQEPEAHFDAEPVPG